MPTDSIVELIAQYNLKKGGRTWYDLPAWTAGKPWALSGDWLIIGDVHVPCTDWHLAGLVAEVAKKHKIKRLLIAGDLFNMDSFSAYDQVIEPPTWAQEREAAKVLLGKYLEWFGEIKILMGNHERRLQRYTAGAFDTGDILSLITTNERVQLSPYGYCMIDDWRVTHPKNYRQIPLSQANDLSTLHECHIISFHEHHCGKSWSKSGRHVIVNGGSLADETRLAYMVLDDRPTPRSKRGFVKLQNGVAELYGPPPFTDWSGYK